MTITVGTPVKATNLASSQNSVTLTNFVVATANQLLLAFVLHEDAFNVTDASMAFGAAGLTKLVEARQTSGNQAGVSIWGLANPSISTTNLVATLSTSLTVQGVTVVAVLVDGADLSNGLTSAINATANIQTGSAGTSISQTINPTVSGTVILDVAMMNDSTLGWAAANSQTAVDFEVQTGGSGYSWKIGQAAGGASGARTLGYATASGSFLRASYASIAIKSGTTSTLSDLVITPSANLVPGEAWSASITGRTSGSTISASCNDGTPVTWNSGTNLLSAIFTTPGAKMITLTEILAGAPNTPHVSPGQTSTILAQVKIGVAGSSTPAGWFNSNFATTETANTRLRCWNGSAFVAFNSVVASGKGAGGVAFGNYLLNKLGADYRVDLVPGALGGTFLLDWANKGAQPGGYYNEAKAAFTAAGGVAAVAIHLGSNDARADAVSSRADHESKYRTVIANLRSDLGASSLPVFIMGCQRWTAAAANASDDIFWSRARAGEQNVADDANVYLGATAVDLTMYGDDVHLSEAREGGNAIEARRTAHSISNALFGGTQRYRGPKPGSSSYNAVTGWITISFTAYGGAELVGKTGQSGLTGFIFLAGGSPVSPVTTPFVSGPAQVAAQLATGLSGVTYTYQESHAPDIGNGLFDNGPVPAEP